MSHPGLNQLKLAEELFDIGNLNEALEIFNYETQFRGFSLQEKRHFQFLKGLIGLGLATKYEQAFNFSKELESELKSISNVSKEMITQRSLFLSVAKMLLQRKLNLITIGMVSVKSI